MTNKITSNISAAQQAVSKLTGITKELKTPSVSFSGSTVSSMTKGKKVNAQVLTDLTNLANCIWKQAEKFPQLAEKIEQRDQQDAGQFGGTK